MSKESDILLGVNIDHVATLRQARGEAYPDIIKAAQTVLSAGADSITVHLREDRRHIQDADVYHLKQLNGLILNLEMAATDEMVTIASDVKPEYCCIVPEKREELTTEGGLDIISARDKIRVACEHLKDAGIRVSLFIDADEQQIHAAKEVGAQAIEIHTGHYANAGTNNDVEAELNSINTAVELGVEIGLLVNAGHGLNYDNVQAIAGNPHIHELNIGHSIVSHAVFVGLANAVSEMKRLMLESRQ